MANHFSILALRIPWTVRKGKKDRTLKDELPRLVGAQYATGKEWRNTPERMKRRSQSKNNTQLWMWRDGSKVRCCKEQYCIRTWNIRSTNQGKLEVVKQEMARVNTDILGISELKWTWMGEFNSDDHYMYYYEQESLRRNGVALTVNKSLKGSTWMQSQKWHNDLCLFPRQTIQCYCNTSLCPNL